MDHGDLNLTVPVDLIEVYLRCVLVFVTEEFDAQLVWGESSFKARLIGSVDQIEPTVFAVIALKGYFSLGVILPVIGLYHVNIGPRPWATREVVASVVFPHVDQASEGTVESAGLFSDGLAEVEQHPI